MDVGTFDDRIAGALDDFEPQEAGSSLQGWQRSDLINDISIGNAQGEIERRIRLMGATYPFSLKGNFLLYKPSVSGYYEFCLSISLAQSVTKGDYVQLPRHFERTTAILIKAYMGNNSEALHTGWPRDEGCNPRFKNIMTLLFEKSGEWIWNPRSGLPEDPDPTHVKDEGVDFVVWKNSLDDRLGHLFLLAQCACGNDWGDKLTELNLNRFEKWFNPSSYVSPIRSFITPFILSDGNLVDALEQAGLVFDRVRLTAIAEQNHKTPEIGYMKPLISSLANMVLYEGS